MVEARLTSLEFSGYDGLQLTGIYKFKFKPKKDKIVIIGPNGAGKTRLVSIIYPHAVTPVELEDGGYIKHEYIRGKDHYRFQQLKKGKSLKCSIWKNGSIVVEDANPTVYNDNVTAIFNFDKKFISILLKHSKHKLCEMKAPDRKYWFSQLAASDLSDALKYFKELKILQRDNTGAIKVTERYVSDMKPLVLKDKEESDTLNERLKELENHYQIINEHWVNYQGGNNNLENYLDELESLSNSIMADDYTGLAETEYYNKLQSELYADMNHRQTYIIPRINNELTNLETELKEVEFYSKNLVEFESKVKVLKDRILTLKSIENEFLAEVVTLPELTIQATLRDLESFVSDINQHISVLKDTTSLKELTAAREAQGKIVDELRTKVGEQRSKLIMAEEYYERFRHVETVDCPHCKGEFKPGLDKDLDKVANFISTKKPEIEKLESDIALEMEKLNVCTDAEFARQNMQNCVLGWRDNPGFTPLVNHINRAVGFQPSLNVSIWADEYKIALANTLDIIRTTADLKEFEDKQLIAAAAAGKDKNGVIKRIDGLTQQLQEENEAVSSLKGKIKEAGDLQLRAKLADDKGARLKELHNKFDSEVEQQMRYYLNEYLSKTKDELWGLITSVRERKATLDKMSNELAINEKRLAELRVEKETLDKLVKELSPSDGILAEYLYRSIYAITDSMNIFIEEVFNYPLVVKPCDVDNGELDYKFPFVEGESKTERAEISIGSEGQQEIFNNVFVLSAIKALNLEGNPLLLDEPGRTFSPGHRQRFGDFIEGLYSSNYCSQIFVISHFTEFHSRLGNVEFVVLGEEGVDLPDNYNENVEIEYK